MWKNVIWFFVKIFENILDGSENFALIKGKISPNKNIRVNREIISTNYQRNFDLLLTKNILKEQKLDINISSSNINNLLSKGINPDKESWEEISKIAFRTFVPESEESRAKGAGGGDAND